MPTSGRVFITGACGGLGQGFAKYYAGQGYALTLSDVRDEDLERTVRALKDYEVDVRTVAADLTTRSGLETVVQAVRASSDLEILINNAGIAGKELLAEECLDLHVAQLDINARAPLCLSWAAVSVMRDRRRGAIINVASLAGLRPGSPGLNYGATKSYVVFLSKSLQLHVAELGIKVQALCPGFVDTPINPPEFKRQFGSLLWIEAEKAARVSHRALRKKRVVVMTGWGVRLNLWAWKLGQTGWFFRGVRMWDRLLRRFNMLPPLPAEEQASDAEDNA